MFTKEKTKGFVAGCIATIVLTAALGVFSSPVEKLINVVYSGIKIVLDGVEVQPKDANGNAVEPFIFNGTTYLPVRALSQAFGKDVTWDGNTSTIYLGIVPKVLLTVNGEDLMVSEYMNYLFDSKRIVSAALSQSGQTLENGTYNGKSAMQAAKDMALDTLIQDTVTAQKAKASGIVIDDNARKMISDKKDSVIESAGGKAQFESQLKSIGSSEGDITKSIERAYYKFALYNKISAEPQIQPSADVLKDYFSKNYVRAHHILIMTVDAQQQPLSAEAKKVAKDKADALLAQLKAGADFIKLMNENSEDPGSKSQPDGYIFGKGDMVKPFEDAAFALKDGEISGIVESQFGYHIIRRENAMEKYDTYIADANNKKGMVNIIVGNIFANEVKAWVADAKTIVVKNELDAIK